MYTSVNSNFSKVDEELCLDVEIQPAGMLSLKLLYTNVHFTVYSSSFKI